MCAAKETLAIAPESYKTHDLGWKKENWCQFFAVEFFVNQSFRHCDDIFKYTDNIFR